MTELRWHRSSHCEAGSSCVYLAAGPKGTIHLRESDEPHIVLTTTRARLNPLISAIKAGTLSGLMPAANPGPTGLDDHYGPDS